VLPSPLPIADEPPEPPELEPPEALEFDDDGEEEGALPVRVVVPKRLVAAVNAEDEFELEPADELEPVELEADEEEPDAPEPEEVGVVLPLLLAPPPPPSRPRSLWLPRRLGVTREA